MEDPGWSGIWRKALVGLIPFGLGRVHRAPGIATLRSVFVSYVAAVLLFGIPLAFVTPRSQSGDTTTICLVAVIVAGAVGIGAAHMFRGRPLDVSSAVALADAYRSNFFLKLAFAEFIALVGFTLTFVSGSYVVYPIAVALSLVAFAVAAPTRSDVTDRQDEIRRAGSPLDLLQVLQTEPWKTRGSRS
jgi:hypothetical protein